MEIIHIILGKANPNRMNGVNKVVNSIATFQTKLGHNVNVWGITKNAIHDYPERNYKTVLFKQKSKFFLPKGLRNKINNQSAETIFHFHGGFIPQYILIVRHILKIGAKYVFTPHGSYNSIAMERSNLKKKLYIFLFEKALVENAKSIHFIGKSEIQGAKELFAINNYQLVPNGQNLGGIYISRINKNDTTFPIFGFCGRLDVKTKGLDILMKGFAEYLSKNEGKSELWLIGDGERKYDLMLLAQNLGISNQVFFLGSLYGQEKVDTIKQLDYFTLTSRNEGLPGVILEASVLGVPCIVSEATNMGDFIKTNKAGIVLEKNTPSSISKALKTALTWKQNGRIVRIKHNAKKMVINQFNWTRIVRQLDQLYA